MNKPFLFIILCVCVSLPVATQNYPHQSDILWVTTPDRTDWIYQTGENATIDVAVYEYGVLLDNQEITYSIGQGCLEPDTQGSVTLENGKARIAIGTMDKPGFRDCQLSLQSQGRTYKHHIKVGFSPEQIVPYTQMPDDFEDFWKRALEEQARCPMLPEVKYVEEYSSDKVECYLVKLQCDRPG